MLKFQKFLIHNTNCEQYFSYHFKATTRGISVRLLV